MNAKRTDRVVPFLLSVQWYRSLSHCYSSLAKRDLTTVSCYRARDLDVVWQAWTLFGRLGRCLAVDVYTHATAVADGLVLLHREVTGLSLEGTKFYRLALFCLLH